ncbi:MAG: DNA polymerase III subunit beta [Verrucomicrobiae bacterium]|nr:DNA polymerase III subunit beta [Verrucomicrobiae bacterium]
MKLRFTKENFVDGLQQVLNVVSTRSTLPILSNVLIRAEKGGVSMTTTDLDLGVRCRIQAEVVREGATTLPARRLFAIIREMAATDIELEVDEKNVAAIQGGPSHFKVLGLPESEFPPFPKVEESRAVAVEQKALRDLLRRTAYAMSADESRFVLNGILMSFKDDKLIVVATDGRRLAMAEQEVELSKDCKQDLIIPNKTVLEVARLLKDKGQAKVRFSESQVLFEIEGAELASKLVEGIYPNYRQVIPPDAKVVIPLEREALLQAVHRAALLTTEKNQAVRLAFTRNKLTITANSPDLGESRESLAVNYNGPEIAIGFNPAFLMDPLRNLENDEVRFELTDEYSPGVMKIKEPFLYVIMPLRTGAT